MHDEQDGNSGAGSPATDAAASSSPPGGQRHRFRGIGQQRPGPTVSAFQLAEEWLQLTEAVEAAGGELTEETEAEFRRLVDAFGTKVDAYGAVFQTYGLAVAGLDDRIAALAKQRAARLRLAERVKGRLLEAMVLAGAMRWQGDTYGARRGSSSAVVFDEERGEPDPWDVPPEFVDPQAPKISKARIKRALEDGRTVEGWAIEPRPWVALE